VCISECAAWIFRSPVCNLSGIGRSETTGISRSTSESPRVGEWIRAEFKYLRHRPGSLLTPLYYEAQKLRHLCRRCIQRCANLCFLDELQRARERNQSLLSNICLTSIRHVGFPISIKSPSFWGDRAAQWFTTQLSVSLESYLMYTY